MTKKQPNSDRSSPYFSETASINSTPTLDDLYQEMNALNLTTSSVVGGSVDLRQRRQTDIIGGLDYLHSVLGSDGVDGSGGGGGGGGSNSSIVGDAE